MNLKDLVVDSLIGHAGLGCSWLKKKTKFSRKVVHQSLKHFKRSVTISILDLSANCSSALDFLGHYHSTCPNANLNDDNAFYLPFFFSAQASHVNFHCEKKRESHTHFFFFFFETVISSWCLICTTCLLLGNLIPGFIFNSLQTTKNTEIKS